SNFTYNSSPNPRPRPQSDGGGSGNAAAEAAQTVVEPAAWRQLGELAIMNRSRRQSTVNQQRLTATCCPSESTHASSLAGGIVCLRPGTKRNADSDVTSSVWLDALATNSSGVLLASLASAAQFSGPILERPTLSTSGIPARRKIDASAATMTVDRRTLSRVACSAAADASLRQTMSRKSARRLLPAYRIDQRRLCDADRVLLLKVRRSPPMLQTELTHQPEFVHMQTLTRGAVFGLQDLFKPDQPSLCVVSNGAECLLSPAADRLRNRVTHYPSRAQLQTRLQERVNWEAYKQLLVRGAVGDSRRRPPCRPARTASTAQRPRLPFAARGRCSATPEAADATSAGESAKSAEKYQRNRADRASERPSSDKGPEQHRRRTGPAGHEHAGRAGQAGLVGPLGVGRRIGGSKPQGAAVFQSEISGCRPVEAAPPTRAVGTAKRCARRRPGRCARWLRRTPCSCSMSSQRVGSGPPNDVGGAGEESVAAPQAGWRPPGQLGVAADTRALLDVDEEGAGASSGLPASGLTRCSRRRQQAVGGELLGLGQLAVVQPGHGGGGQQAGAAHHCGILADAQALISSIEAAQAVHTIVDRAVRRPAAPIGGVGVQRARCQSQSASNGRYSASAFSTASPSLSPVAVANSPTEAAAKARRSPNSANPFGTPAVLLGGPAREARRPVKAEADVASETHRSSAAAAPPVRTAANDRKMSSARSQP
uniref:Cyclic nucleotide-binding domain-containing protein n=1 Tax=Macrostomum lignano TaxID=282301 RepID=A0A1I8FQH1_9PLAT